MDRISVSEQRLLKCLEEIGSLPLPMSAEDWERLEQLEITVRLADSRVERRTGLSPASRQ